MKQTALKLYTYGVFYLFYTCAFIFGALYPQYGVPMRAKTEEDVREIQDDEEDIDELLSYYDENNDILYKSYFLEKIKELF